MQDIVVLLCFVFCTEINSDADRLMKYLIDVADRDSLFVFASDFSSVLKSRCKKEDKKQLVLILISVQVILIDQIMFDYSATDFKFSGKNDGRGIMLLFCCF